MLFVEPITKFDGFGTGKQPGEYFLSRGMQKSQFGISPRRSVIKDTDNGTLTNLLLMNWFSQGQFSGDSFVFGFDSGARLYKAALGSNSWSEEHHVAISSRGNGLIVDQTNRLLYANDGFLGMYDGASFTDSWKDFTLTTEDFRPMDTYEDWVVIGNLNQIALLNVTDDSFNADAFNLPSGFNIRCVKSGANGILIGANFNNRGVLILWQPNYTRSIAPWIWRNRTIQSIIPTASGWIVITQGEIFFTNGYSVTPIIDEFPDNLKNGFTITNSVLPQGAELQGNNLVFWGSQAEFNRQLGGIYILNLDTKLFEFVPVSNDVVFGVNGGAVFFDNNNATHLSYLTQNPNTKFIGQLINFAGPRASFISEQLGASGNEKVAEGVKFSLGISSHQVITPDIQFDIAVKVCNARRNIFGWGVTNTSSAALDVLQVDGTLTAPDGINRAEIGDEVTILEGVNAGQVAHIINIENQGTNTETWTLDTELENLTEGSVHFSVSPFKLADKFQVNTSELKELYFNVQNRIKGKKFFTKVVFENLPQNLMLELKDGQFIYSELGVKR